jgi:hypothetical protein
MFSILIFRLILKWHNRHLVLGKELWNRVSLWEPTACVMKRGRSSSDRSGTRNPSDLPDVTAGDREGRVILASQWQPHLTLVGEPHWLSLFTEAVGHISCGVESSHSFTVDLLNGTFPFCWIACHTDLYGRQTGSPEHTKDLLHLAVLPFYLLTYGAEPFLRSCQLCSHSENSQQL